LRPEDLLAEQPVLLGAVRAVVDRLRLLDLAVRPRSDVLRAGQGDADRAEVVDPLVAGALGGGVGVLPVVGGGGAHIRIPFAEGVACSRFKACVGGAVNWRSQSAQTTPTGGTGR